MLIVLCRTDNDSSHVHFIDLLHFYCYVPIAISWSYCNFAYIERNNILNPYIFGILGQQRLKLEGFKDIGTVQNGYTT